MSIAARWVRRKMGFICLFLPFLWVDLFILFFYSLLGFHFFISGSIVSVAFKGTSRGRPILPKRRQDARTNMSREKNTAYGRRQQDKQTLYMYILYRPPQEKKKKSRSAMPILAQGRFLVIDTSPFQEKKKKVCFVSSARLLWNGGRCWNREGCWPRVFTCDTWGAG